MPELYTVFQENTTPSEEIFAASEFPAARLLAAPRSGSLRARAYPTPQCLPTGLAVLASLAAVVVLVLFCWRVYKRGGYSDLRSRRLASTDDEASSFELCISSPSDLSDEEEKDQLSRSPHHSPIPDGGELRLPLKKRLSARAAGAGAGDTRDDGGHPQQQGEQKHLPKPAAVEQSLSPASSPRREDQPDPHPSPARTPTTQQQQGQTPVAASTGLTHTPLQWHAAGGFVERGARQAAAGIVQDFHWDPWSLQQHWPREPWQQQQQQQHHLPQQPSQEGLYHHHHHRVWHQPWPHGTPQQYDQQQSWLQEEQQRFFLRQQEQSRLLFQQQQQQRWFQHQHLFEQRQQQQALEQQRQQHLLQQQQHLQYLIRLRDQHRPVQHGERQVAQEQQSEKAQEKGKRKRQAEPKLVEEEEEEQQLSSDKLLEEEWIALASPEHDDSQPGTSQEAAGATADSGDGAGRGTLRRRRRRRRHSSESSAADSTGQEAGMDLEAATTSGTSSTSYWIPTLVSERLSPTDLAAMAKHPYARLPKIPPKEVSSQYAVDLRCAVSGWHYRRDPMWMLRKVHDTLLREELSGSDLSGLSRAASVLIAHAMRHQCFDLSRHSSTRAVERMGLRFLIMDAVVSALILLGQERKGEYWDIFTSTVSHAYPVKVVVGRNPGRTVLYTWWVREISMAIETLKKGERPAVPVLLKIKRMLFHSDFAPPLFRRPDFDPWKNDDNSDSDGSAGSKVR